MIASAHGLLLDLVELRRRFPISLGGFSFAFYGSGLATVGQIAATRVSTSDNYTKPRPDPTDQAYLIV
jgi:hypothetical protein